MGSIEQSKSDTYLLARDNEASNRLSFQHFTLKSRQGWLLHPKVRANLSNSDTLRVADLATGNAIWTFDLAKEYPDAEIIGFDISDAQYPAAPTRPANVSLQVLSLLDKVPPRYQDYFDVVHIRLVVAAMYSMNKDRLMSNVISMVKPGGYLQWEEVNQPTVVAVDRHLNVIDNMPEAVQAFYKVAPFQAGTIWAETLPEVFQEYGLVDTQRYKPALDPSTMPLETQANTWVIREFLGFAASCGREGVLEQMEIAEKDIRRMRRAGEFWCYAWMVALGRKPLQSERTC